MNILSFLSVDRWSIIQCSWFIVFRQIDVGGKDFGSSGIFYKKENNERNTMSSCCFENVRSPVG